MVGVFSQKIILQFEKEKVVNTLLSDKTSRQDINDLYKTSSMHIDAFEKWYERLYVYN